MVPRIYRVRPKAAARWGRARFSTGTLAESGTVTSCPNPAQPPFTP